MLPRDHPPETVDRVAYVFCVLDQFHQRLCRRDIFAVASSRWADPRAQLLSGQAWKSARFVVPVRSIDTRPNPKFFGRKKGTTLLNMINDQGVGLAGLVLAGTPRRSVT